MHMHKWKKNYKQVWKAKIRKQFDGKIYERAPEQNPGKYVCAAGKNAVDAWRRLQLQLQQRRRSGAAPKVEKPDSRLLNMPLPLDEKCGLQCRLFECCIWQIQIRLRYRYTHTAVYLASLTLTLAWLQHL